MAIDNYLFTLNNIRGFRRFLSFRKELKKSNIKLKLITSSFSTYLISKLFLIDVVFLMKIINQNTKQLTNGNLTHKEDLFINSIKAEVDQEINYSKFFKKKFLSSKIFKAINTYLNSYDYFLKKKNLSILGYNSNIINQISICLAAKETENKFFSIVPINPPAIVGITEGLPYLREIVFDDSKENDYLNFDNKVIINKKEIKKYRLTSYSYLNKYETLIRKIISRILIHIDDLYNLIIYLSVNNSNVKKQVKKIYKLIETNSINDGIKNWITNIPKNENKFNQRISLFEGNLEESKNYHVFFCSSPLESENYFPGMNNEFEILLRLSKQFSYSSKDIFIARLHPGWEHKYSKFQLYNLSKNGVKIWDKRKCNQFKLGNSPNIIKYTTCGTIFLESLGKPSPCFVTSEAFKSCKSYLEQPSPFDKEKTKIFLKNWETKSNRLKDKINKSCWEMQYYDPYEKFTPNIVTKILRIIDL